MYPTSASAAVTESVTAVVRSTVVLCATFLASTYVFGDATLRRLSRNRRSKLSGDAHTGQSGPPPAEYCRPGLPSNLRCRFLVRSYKRWMTIMRAKLCGASTCGSRGTKEVMMSTSSWDLAGLSDCCVPSSASCACHLRVAASVPSVARHSETCAENCKRWDLTPPRSGQSASDAGPAGGGPIPRRQRA